MFKKTSAADDLASLMEKQLTANAVEESYSFDKIAKAVNYLNSAADIFDDVGLGAEAETITNMLESLAKKSKKSDKHLKNLTSKKQVKNLLEHGHPLNKADDMKHDENCVNCANDTEHQHCE